MLNNLKSERLIILYAFFDGDNIGSTIEILLIENKVYEARKLSQNINTVIFEIEKILQSKDNIEIIILGGDDILIRYDTTRYGEDFLESIRNLFKAKTGNSMSCGVGRDISESIRNLYLAKLYGKNMVKSVKYLDEK